MASNEFNVNPYSSDKEEVFPGFSVEEIAEIRQQRQHQDFNREIEEMFHESGTNSAVEFFASEDEDDEEEDDESNESADEYAPPDPLQWLNTLSDINVEEFSVRHGPTKDLGGQATSKDFLNLFINDDYLDEIARCSVAYARSKGDESFITNRAEISAYLGLNILMGIHRLPQLEMFWDSDEFIGVEGFKKTIPKQRFKTLGKYLHLVDPGDEDANDVLCKVRSLVTLLEDKFADAYIPGKNVSVDEGLVKFNGRLSFKQYMPMKPDKFGIKVWMLADADNYYVPRFQVYLGKNRTNSELFQLKGLGYYVVWTLGEPYLDDHRHFFFDNFFTSTDLMRDLESRDTYACGTVRINRRDFPADLKQEKLVRGEIHTRQCGNLVATMWKYKRFV